MESSADDGGAVVGSGFGPGDAEGDGLDAGGLFSEVGARVGQRERVGQTVGTYDVETARTAARDE